MRLPAPSKTCTRQANTRHPSGVEIQAWSRRFALALRLSVLVGALVVAGCNCGRKADDSRVPPVATATATPEPTPELVLGFRIAQPVFGYGALRGLSKRPLPQSVNFLLTGLLGLSPTVSGRFVAGQDWLGALVAVRGGGVGWSLAVPVTSGRELIAELCLGADATFRAKPQLGWTEFTGVVGGPLGPLVAGVSGNFLVFGSSAPALAVLAPWLKPSSHAALAPEQSEPGLSGRLFAAGTSLQALHQVARETWSPALLAAPLTTISNGASSVVAFAAIEQLLSARISAYLGILRGGDLHVRWQGDRIALSGDFPTRGTVRSKRGGALCRELASLPKGVRVWFAGTEATLQPSLATAHSASYVAPDWDEAPGDWQEAVLGGLGVLGAAFANRVALQDSHESRFGMWVLAWRERAGASTALAVLDGVAPTSIQVVPGVSATHVGRVQSLAKDGHHVEWVWDARGNGTITAVGAALGDVWNVWSREQPTTGWPRGVSPSQCDALLAAVGTDAGVLAALFETADGVQVTSELDLSVVDGLLQ